MIEHRCRRCPQKTATSNGWARFPHVSIQSFPIWETTWSAIFCVPFITHAAISLLSWRQRMSLLPSPLTSATPANRQIDRVARPHSFASPLNRPEMRERLGRAEKIGSSRRTDLVKTIGQISDIGPAV